MLCAAWCLAFRRLIGACDPIVQFGGSGIEIKHKKWESVGVLEGQQITDQFKPAAAIYHIDGNGPAVAAGMHELDALVRLSQSQS